MILLETLLSLTPLRGNVYVKGKGNQLMICSKTVNIHGSFRYHEANINEK